MLLTCFRFIVFWPRVLRARLKELSPSLAITQGLCLMNWSELQETLYASHISNTNMFDVFQYVGNDGRTTTMVCLQRTYTCVLTWCVSVPVSSKSLVLPVERLIGLYLLSNVKIISLFYMCFVSIKYVTFCLKLAIAYTQMLCSQHEVNIG